MTFRFLELPTELRLAIYSELLAVSLRLGVVLSDHRPPRKYHSFGNPAILRTCKSIYKEAVPILYGNNTFLFACDSWEDLNSNFTQTMGPTNAALMKHLMGLIRCDAASEDVVAAAIGKMGLQWNKLRLFGMVVVQKMDSTTEDLKEQWRGQPWLDELEWVLRPEAIEEGVQRKYSSLFVKKGGMRLPLPKISTK